MRTEIQTRKNGLRFVLSIACIGIAGAIGFSNPGSAAEVPPKGKSPTIDRIKQSGTLRAGINVALPWLGQNPTTREFFGPSMDLGKKIADSLGVKLELTTSASDVIVAGLQANQFDLAIAPLFATPKRREVVEFVTYTIAGQCYAVRKDNDKVKTLADLNNPAVSIGTWTGSGSEQAVKAKYTNVTINSIVMPVGGANRMEEVMAKRIDAATLDSARAHLVEHQFPQLKIIPGGAAECIKNPDVPTAIGMALAKGDPEFKKYLEAVVAEMQPAINASIEKYSSLEYMLPK
ncbi:MAG: transporter substrate-binding domain-containing protein [Betaproteobacteria bacterium]